MAEEYKLRLGDAVEIDSELWIWESVRRGAEARLRRDGTADDWLSLSMPELIAHAGTARRDSNTPLRRDLRRLACRCARHGEAPVGGVLWRPDGSDRESLTSAVRRFRDDAGAADRVEG